MIAFVFVITQLNVAIAQNGQWSNVIVDSTRNFEILDEDKLFNEFDDPAANEKIRAHLIVNNDSLRSIKYTDSSQSGDTLKIIVSQTDPAYHHTYQISMVKNRFTIEYNFLTSGVPVTRKIRPKALKLILNSWDFRKAKEIRGYTQFKGRCIEGCWEDFVSIKGNFKVVLE